MSTPQPITRELAIAMRQVVRAHLNSFEPRPKRGRRVAGGGGGGGSGGVEGILAVVTVSAGESEHDAGGITFGDAGKCVLLDEDGAKETGDEGEELEFKSVHRVAIPAGAIIQLSAPAKIEPGSTWDENKVKGRFIDVTDELRQRPGFAEKKALAVKEGGTEPDDMEWLGAEC